MGRTHRDGSATRTVPALVQQLKLDNNKEARVAAAKALGQIGDPSAAAALQLASTYDKKRDVREAAAVAYGQLHAPRDTSRRAIPRSRPCRPGRRTPPAMELEPLDDQGEPPTKQAEPYDEAPSQGQDAAPSSPPPLEPPPIEGENVPPPPTPSNQPGFSDTP